MGGVRLSYAISQWLALATRFRPALEAFIKLRDEKEIAFRANSSDFDSFMDVHTLNHNLDEDRRTIALFKETANISPENAKRLYHVVEQILVAEGMHQDCAPFLESKSRLNRSIDSYESALQYEESSYRKDSPLRGYARKHFLHDSVRLIGLLALNNRHAEAVTVRQRCIAVLDDDEFRGALDNAVLGYLPKYEGF